MAGEARVAGHVEVEHEHVGAVRAHVAAGVGDVAGLGHDLEALLAVEEHPEAAAHHAVVVGDHDLGHRGQASGRGTLATAVVAITATAGNYGRVGGSLRSRQRAAAVVASRHDRRRSIARRSGGPALAAALARPETYPGRPGPVEVRETHISWVFLAGDRAYKLKKPVGCRSSTTGPPERRREMCEEEVRLNRRLAPRVYLGRRGRRRRPRTAWRSRPRTTRDAIDYVVEMRRFDEARTLAARVRSGGEPYPALVAVGAAARGVPRRRRRARDGGYATAALHAALDENIDTLLDARARPRVRAPGRRARALHRRVLRRAPRRAGGARRRRPRARRPRRPARRARAARARRRDRRLPRVRPCAARRPTSAATSRS